MFKEPPLYRSYLLTLREEQDHQPTGPPIVRFRLEDPRTGQQQGFASLEGLYVALQEVVANGGQEREQTSAALLQGLPWIKNIDH